MFKINEQKLLYLQFVKTLDKFHVCVVPFAMIQFQSFRGESQTHHIKDLISCVLSARSITIFPLKALREPFKNY